MRMMAATWAAIAIASTALAARESTEATLSQQLNELEPGKPVDCVSLHHVRSSRIIDRTAIIFEARGVLYLNRPTAGAELLVNDKAILTKSESGEICRGEAVQLFDAASGVQSGSIFLGPFVPYRKKAYEEMPYQAPASGY